MRLYLSGAKTANDIQTEISKSLGGYISSSYIPNKRLNNIFDDISQTKRINGDVEVKAVFLKNDFANAVNNITLSYSYNVPNVKLEIAAIQVGDNNLLETINNSNEEPYYAEFFEANLTAEEDNTVLIGDLLPGQAIGLWLKRTIIKDAFDVETMFQQFVENEEKSFDVLIEHKISLNIGWDDPVVV